VVSQEVVNIEAGPGNGWRLIETGMGAMPVVAVDPGSEVGESVGGVLVELGVGPFADGGLDEAFGFAVGAWGVDAGADRSDTEAAAGGGEAARTETGTVVGQDAAHGDTQVREVGHGLAEKAAGRETFFIGQHGGEGDAGVIVNGHVEKLPAGPAGFVLRIAGEAMTGFADAREFFDVEVQQIAGSGMLITNDGNGRLERSSGVEFQTGEDAADGGAAQADGLGDAHTGPALTAQLFDAGHLFGGNATRGAMRARRAIAQSRHTALTEAADPLGGRLPAELELGRGRVQAQLPRQNSLGELLSTVNRESRMMVVVHSVSWLAFASQHQLPSSRPNGQQPLETSQLKPDFARG
jgi:hypothetical protein